ncbi:hypothetical protein [Sulfurospirillum sp. 1612]
MSIGSIVALSILGIIIGGLYFFEKMLLRVSITNPKNSNNQHNSKKAC